jgi:hypothetical protein
MEIKNSYKNSCLNNEKVKLNNKEDKEIIMKLIVTAY